MRFTIAVLIASVSAALFTATPAEAVDNRVLVKYSGRTPTDFCNQWRCNCINYVPKDQSLTFGTAYCQPGDSSGNNRDTEARVFCTFKDSNGKSKSVLKHVAAATNATIA